MKSLCRVLLLALFGTLSLASLQADVRLPALISDHMVLQRAERVPLWGWADPGEEIRVTFNGQTQNTTATAQGRWQLALDLKDSPPGPFTLEVRGKNTITVNDVLVGEVWIASGQSNMEFLLKEVLEAKEIIAESANSQLRHFDVENNAVAEPADDCKGRWVISAPDVAGRFSAVAYYFSRALQQELHVPVGLINSTWGGSPAEAWISREALFTDPELKTGAERFWEKARLYPSQKEQYVAQFGEWLKANGREDKPSSTETFTGPTVDTRDWIPVKLPGDIAAPGLSAHGALWLRKEVDLPPTSARKPVRVELGVFDGFESVYWNGKKLTESTYQTYPGRAFYSRVQIPADLANAGKNTLSLRIYAPAEPARLSNLPERFQAMPIPLAGEWLAKQEYVLPPPTTPAPKAPENPPLPHHTATYLFNGMIQPLLPCSIRGVIWYQGESNTSRAVQYRTTFPMLICDWRQRWGRGDFPFYFCQLANFNPKVAQPGESDWAELREAQTLALKLPNTAQAVLIDVGESGDIHPRNKKDVGLRLARLALARQYNKPVVDAAPMYESMTIQGGSIRLRFQNTAGGLVARALPDIYIVNGLNAVTAPLVRNSPGSELEGFAICGEDRKWVWAEAKIIAPDTVVVSSPLIPAPIAVRYAWASNPTCNLYNDAGLPASPFRTDNFPESTLGKRY